MIAAFQSPRLLILSLQRITETGRSLSHTIPDYPAGVTHSQPGHHPYVLR